jgi:hypothetical protein
LFAILLVVCIVPANAQSRNRKGIEGAEKNQIPEGFNPSVGVLLIEDSAAMDNTGSDMYSNRKYQHTNYFLLRNRKKMDGYLTENYSYKYEFAPQNAIYSGTEKFFDKTVYRYALVISLEIREFSFDEKHNQPVFNYYIYDRLNNISYAYLDGGASLIMVAFRKAMKRINGGN